jgi:hypothetical protein
VMKMRSCLKPMTFRLVYYETLFLLLQILYLLFKKLINYYAWRNFHLPENRKKKKSLQTSYSDKTLCTHVQAGNLSTLKFLKLHKTLQIFKGDTPIQASHGSQAV